MIESAKLMIANPRTGMLLRNLSGCLFAAVSICVKQSRPRYQWGPDCLFPFGICAHSTGDFPVVTRGVPARARDTATPRAPAALKPGRRRHDCIIRLDRPASAREATLFTYLSPAFRSVAGVLLLSQRLTVWRIGGVVLGLAGVPDLVLPELGHIERDAGRMWGYI